MDGQLSIFDFPEYLPEKEKSDFPCDDCIYEEGNCCAYKGNGVCVLGDKRISQSDYESSKRIPVDIKGLMDDGYCPTCGSSLQDEIDACPYCGTKLDWTRWREMI